MLYDLDLAFDSVILILRFNGDNDGPGQNLASGFVIGSLASESGVRGFCSLAFT